jgi:hypothetical protein
VTLSTVGSFELTFDEALHEYRITGGRVVPSVTRILHGVGIATDFEAIAARSSRLAEAIEYRRALGTAAHADCHAFDDEDFDWHAVDERVRPYIEAWAIFRENSKLRPQARERRVFHPGLFYAGTLDGVFENEAGQLVLVDMKLGDPEDAGARYQTAAYEAAYLLDHPERPITHRWAVQLQPERRIPYEIFDYSARPQAWRDFQVFQAAVAVYGVQAARRTAA